MRVRLAAGVAALAVAAAALGGCGSDSPDQPAKLTNLTIYSGLPLQGPLGPTSASIVKGEKLALTQAGGQVGKYTVRYVSLDDSSAGAGGWDAKSAAGAARKAVQDQSTIAYLGDIDTGATAITIPILNEAGTLQISPAATAVGFTRSEGADKGEPEKYQPTGRQNFGRVIPADDVQAAAQVALQRRKGCTHTYLLADDTAYGRDLVAQMALLAPARGLQVTDGGVLDTGAPQDKLIAQLTTSGADCIFLGMEGAQTALALMSDLHTARPQLKIFGPASLATAPFAAGVGRELQGVLSLTAPGLPLSASPPAARAFDRAYRRTYGEAPGMYAIFGYEAMSAALQAIRDAGAKGDDRRAVADAFFAIRNKRSVLGTYSIDSHGDTTLTRYGAYVVRNGRLVFERVLDGATG